MSDICQTGTEVPELITESCNGVYTSTQCIIHPTAISCLNYHNKFISTSDNNALILALQYKDEQISQLTERRKS